MEQVNSALNNYNKVASFSFASKKYLGLFRFSNNETVHISGGIGYSATLGTVEFDLIVSPSGFYGSYINKPGNANFGLYLQKISDTEFVCYASGYDWAYIRFTCSKKITTISARDTLEGTEIEKLVTETKTNSVLTRALTNYEKTDIGISMGVNTTQTITLEQNCCLVFIRGYTSEGKGFYQLYLCSQITSLSNIQVYLLHSGGETNYTNVIISSNASDKITITTTNIGINRVKVLYL